MKHFTLLAASLILCACTSGRSIPPSPPPLPPPPPVDLSSPERAPEPSHYDFAYGAASDSAPDDGAMTPPSPEPSDANQHLAHPLDGVSDKELAERIDDSLSSIGSLSLGSPNDGKLINGIQLPESSEWERVDPVHAWGTTETIEYLTTAIRHVHTTLGDAPVLFIGHLSAQNGGHLRPHVSHQSGRDVDLSFYYTDADATWYAPAHAKNLDLARTWAFVRALLTLTDVELILADRSILALLEDYALAQQEDASWVAGLFHDRGAERAILRHASGHRTHLHVRFFNPVAQETARRSHAILAARGLVDPPMTYLTHRCRSGETLGKLSRRYATSVVALKRANGLRNSKIVAGRTYRIPKPGPPLAPTMTPPRRLPPPSGPD